MIHVFDNLGTERHPVTCATFMSNEKNNYEEIFGFHLLVRVILTFTVFGSFIKILIFLEFKKNMRFDLIYSLLN
ncbi:hypothetical protein SAMN05660909_05146 [Chitinophaga terrae (ex Kim and Jung 2007)]|uniref:Uncharacterized protein n=1 Tax=Chitinophaga terrae (ex Kim and Jung 2007) TaxID=408074 RepID=A0A1H4GBT9_9BACT|nr:hypothetical protein CTE07_49340 [Chitinophaga terrae (ex Kim and Jung 2007)]SEB07014.1 hypothetical protein SAMN05660909_05146 [Chitinophaga terrae (ex Kim and Jung 2007)]